MSGQYVLEFLLIPSPSRPMPKQVRTNENAAYFMKLRDNLDAAMVQLRKVRERQNPPQQAAAKETARR